jgi:outer membrane receptor protein involved in Fe transport
VATLTSGISAEYGRFNGGVVNIVTKTGGNAWSGSFRMTLINDTWSARTPFGEHREQSITPIYEATLGGPVWKDRIWFFGAGRMLDQTSTLTTAPPTSISFPEQATEKRYQLKVTASPSPSQTITVGYTGFNRDDNNTYFQPFPILDLASTYDDTRREHLLLVNYTGSLANDVFLEAHYGQRRLTHVAGSTITDLVNGTYMANPAPWEIYNAPVFCAVCPSPEDVRNSDQGVLKATFLASTRSLGSHSVTAGAEVYKSSWWLNNYQSGTSYAVVGNSVIFDHGHLYPVFGPGTYLQYFPILVPAAPNDLSTYSAYGNDTWRLNERLTFNLGLRWDKNDDRDPAGVSISSEGALSPRLAVTWDPVGKGALRLTASYGRYVSTPNDNQIAWASAWGTPAVLGYFYDGPAINTDPSQPLVSRSDALRELFQWFGITAPGQFPKAGIDPFYVNVPGVSLQMRGDLKSQKADEYSLGVNGSLGTKGSFRVDGVYRTYGDFYAVKLDTTTGTTHDPLGNAYDLGILRNTNAPFERRHLALRTSVQVQPSEVVSIGGSWTWSRTGGNQISESLSAGPNPPFDLTYPEYWQASWRLPTGDLPQDIRHRIRLWTTWDMTFIPARLGHFNLSGIFALDTGLPYGASGPVYVSDYVTNPGYVLPPSYETYWFTRRDAYRTGTVTHLDLALNWNLKVGPVELFVQPQVVNIFNSHAIAQNDPSLIDQGVLTAVNTPSLQPFNPFTQKPVKGVNYALSPTFGQALSPAAYQQPRMFRISMGVRF